MVNQVERAYRTWPILVKCAIEERTITYGNLAKHIGLSHHRPIKFVLEVIQNYCLEENLPPMTILVVDQAGKRGSGFIAWGRDNLDEGVRQVFNYPWNTLPNPFVFAADGVNDYINLSRQLVTNPDTAQDIYSMVKGRGTAQQIFRKALVRSYGGKCAFSGILIKETLEAVHIVPWSKCDPKYRIHIGNGILLSSIHHKLFDNGLISLGEDYRISVSNKLISQQNTSDLMKVLIDEIDGKIMQLPRKKDNWPIVDLIKLRNSIGLAKIA